MPAFHSIISSDFWRLCLSTDSQTQQCQLWTFLRWEQEKTFYLCRNVCLCAWNMQSHSFIFVHYHCIMYFIFICITFSDWLKNCVHFWMDWKKKQSVMPTFGTSFCCHGLSDMIRMDVATISFHVKDYCALNMKMKLMKSRYNLHSESTMTSYFSVAAAMDGDL